MDTLTPFERDVIATILRGDRPVLSDLRAQLAMCWVSKREFTGVGFFTSLAIPSEVPSAELSQRLALGDVHVSMDGVAHGVGIVLFVEDGRLAVLEAFTYDDPWPDEIVNYAITAGGVAHFGGSPTDVEQIEAASVRSDRLP